MDPHINPATGVWDDNYYANVGRFQTGSSGDGSTADSILNDVISSFTGMINKVTPYEQTNPFSFDEKLAREASTAEYEPYYKELLTDYTSNVERTKARSEQDLTRTLSFLASGKEYFVGRERRMLDKAIKSTNEGYAGRGLFFAGQRQKDVEDVQKESATTVDQYLSGYNQNVGSATLANARTTEDVNQKQKEYTRDIGREKQTAIETGVLQRRGEALNEYEIGRKQYYSNAGLYG